MTTLNALVVCLIKTLFFPPLRKHMVSQLWEVRNFLLVRRWLGASFQHYILEKKLSCYHTVLHFFHKYILNFYDLFCQVSAYASAWVGGSNQYLQGLLSFFIYAAISRYMVVHFIRNLFKGKCSSDQQCLFFNNDRRILWAQLYKECTLEKLSNMLTILWLENCV